MVIESDQGNPCCLSCGKEQGSDLLRMVHCDKCDYWFHAYCVNLIDDEQLDNNKQWFCPSCVHKDLPLKHMTKLAQVNCDYKILYNSKGC